MAHQTPAYVQVKHHTTDYESLEAALTLYFDGRFRVEFPTTPLSQLVSQVWFTTARLTPELEIDILAELITTNIMRREGLLAFHRGKLALPALIEGKSMVYHFSSTCENLWGEVRVNAQIPHGVNLRHSQCLLLSLVVFVMNRYPKAYDPYAPYPLAEDAEAIAHIAREKVVMAQVWRFSEPGSVARQRQHPFLRHTPKRKHSAALAGSSWMSTVDLREPNIPYPHKQRLPLTPANATALRAHHAEGPLLFRPQDHHPREAERLPGPPPRLDLLLVVIPVVAHPVAPPKIFAQQTVGRAVVTDIVEITSPFETTGLWPRGAATLAEPTGKTQESEQSRSKSYTSHEGSAVFSSPVPTTNPNATAVFPTLAQHGVRGKTNRCPQANPGRLDDAAAPTHPSKGLGRPYPS